MARIESEKFLDLLPALRESPDRTIRLSYDTEADVMYVNFRDPGTATDSELTEDDIVIRYAGDDVIGLTFLNASSRPRNDRVPPPRK